MFHIYFFASKIMLMALTVFHILTPMFSMSTTVLLVSGYTGSKRLFKGLWILLVGYFN